ncbi:hypothetical protein NGTWS0302_34960 [Mycolicibacterium cyprinidarum]|uniref:Integral membrane protein n=1 Tax=Mycolicibacterium cyprinidarum TaxID=2860311 RepID=A0ABQ4V9X6_9MYCO|nr:hypothetical protein NGTWS0302_34960 [Mycolicibacterium sp. NGTWS0302]GJF15039.1 hypothetical protein NGTWS1702_17800 [Mycolicibacterium sp. NGTWSNA01]GJF17187.1 hypothetical protein NGTWS1803_34430 [Mycolicibacterium sp. NGTWS1803]
MTATISSRLTEATDSLLRFAMRADAVLTGLAGLALLPLVGWLSELSGTTTTVEYGLAAFFIAYGVVVFSLSELPRIAAAGIAVIAANLIYTVAMVAIVVTDIWTLTTTGVILTLATGVYTLAFAELQYIGLRRMRRNAA